MINLFRYFLYPASIVLVLPGYGYYSEQSDHPNIDFSSITACDFSGIYTSSLSADVDLSGVHGNTNSGPDIAAFDTIQGNAKATIGDAQVTLAGGSHIEYADRLSLWNWQHWGENNTIGTAGLPLLIAAYSGTSALGNLDNNFWGTGIDPSTGAGGPGADTWNGTCTIHSNGVAYVAQAANTRTSMTGVENVTCQGFFESEGAKSDGDNPLSHETPLEKDSCDHWHAWNGAHPQSKEEFKMQYDTLRHFVEVCAKNDPDCHDVFNGLSTAVDQYAPEDTTRFRVFREWLISVLYLNTIDPYYFCADLETIAYTYGYDYIPNASIAVLKYLTAHPPCNDKGAIDSYNNAIQSRHDSWLSGDTTVPKDTTLPTLDKIGLGFLLTGSVATGGKPVLPNQYLLLFAASANPFHKETTLRFELSRGSYITFDIFDELGSSVYHLPGRTYETGRQEIVIDGKQLPDGALYARISTGFGEVKTIKLIKE